MNAKLAGSLSFRALPSVINRTFPAQSPFEPFFSLKTKMKPLLIRFSERSLLYQNQVVRAYKSPFPNRESSCSLFSSTGVYPPNMKPGFTKPNSICLSKLALIYYKLHRIVGKWGFPDHRFLKLSQQSRFTDILFTNHGQPE